MKIQENFTIYIPKNFKNFQQNPKFENTLITETFNSIHSILNFHPKNSFFRKSDFEILKDSGIPREEIFVNSKIYNTCYNPNLVPLQLEKSLEGNF